MNHFKKRSSGQVMIISVMILGGILLGAAGISGLLMIFQIRAANDAVNSAKAFFAADTGIEAGSYCILKIAGCTDVASFVAADNSNFTDSAVSVSATSTSDVNGTDIISFGYANNKKVVRNLETILSASSTP